MAETTLDYFIPTDIDNVPSNAVLDKINNEAVLKFEAGIDMAAVWTMVVPTSFAVGGTTFKAYLHWFCEDAVAGNVRWDIAVETDHTGSDKADTDAWGTVAASTVAVPTTAGQILRSAISLTISGNIGNRAYVAGDRIRLRVRRLGKSSALDTCSANVYLANVEATDT